jgi:hypothetical protein
MHNTFRDLHSSHETLNGREVFCRLRLPVPSSPSASEASSSLQVSSSLRSAAFPGESSLLGVRLVLVDMMVGVRDKRNREDGRLGVLLLLLALSNPAHMRQVLPSLLQLDARHAEKTVFSS